MEPNEQFKRFLASLTNEQQEALAQAAETSVAYLKQIASGNRRAGVSLIVRLKAANQDITDEMMRPDLYKAA